MCQSVNVVLQVVMVLNHVSINFVLPVVIVVLYHVSISEHCVTGRHGGVVSCVS